MVTMINFENCKNATAVKALARDELGKLFYEFLVEKFGEEKVSIVGINEVAVAVGEVDGNEVCVTVKPTAKDYENRTTSKKVFEAYDRFILAEEYADKINEKKEEKKKKEEEKRNKKLASKKSTTEKNIEFVEKDSDDDDYVNSDVGF